MFGEKKLKLIRRIGDVSDAFNTDIWTGYASDFMCQTTFLQGSILQSAFGSLLYDFTQVLEHDGEAEPTKSSRLECSC